MKKMGKLLSLLLALVMVLSLCGCGAEQSGEAVDSKEANAAMTAEEAVTQAQQLYDDHQYRECAVFITEILNNYEAQIQGKLDTIMGCALYELGNYEAARWAFIAGRAIIDIEDLNERRLWSAAEYRMLYGKNADSAQSITEVSADELDDVQGTEADIAYLQAALDWAWENYTSAEEQLLRAIDTTADMELQRQALRALAEVYAACADMEDSPIAQPNEKLTEVLDKQMENFSYDGVLWERLGLARYALGQTDAAVEALEKAVELTYCTEETYRILYHEMNTPEDEAALLLKYEEAFSGKYKLHALRAWTLLDVEDSTEEMLREYGEAIRLIRSWDDDDTLALLINFVGQRQRHGGL